jgi:hypothetical protein
MHVPYYTDGFDGPSNAWTSAAGLIRPASRGEIRLLSNDLAAPLLIDANYLSESTDLHRLVDVVEMCRAISHHADFDEWRLREVLPGSTRKKQNKSNRVCKTSMCHLPRHGRNVQDGGGRDVCRGSRAQGLWNKRIARGRRIGNAHSPVWQYPGTDHHDWRKSRRYDRC